MQSKSFTFFHTLQINSNFCNNSHNFCHKLKSAHKHIFFIFLLCVGNRISPYNSHIFIGTHAKTVQKKKYGVRQKHDQMILCGSLTRFERSDGEMSKSRLKYCKCLCLCCAVAPSHPNWLFPSVKVMPH